MIFKILVADDEKNIRSGLAKALTMDGYVVEQVEDGQAAMKMMLRMEIDLIIADLRMPKLSGEELLKKVVSSYPTVPVIILTGHGTVDSAVQAMRDGAYDFLTKPVNLDRLALLIKRALGRRELARKHQELQGELYRLKKRRSGSDMLGRSTPMQRVFEQIEQVAPTRVSVLITGESGTGKELVAQALHEQSPRKDATLVKVHCAALSETLLESELFGHEKGAFTGATGQRKGRFELADGGTIFLDEIGEINQATQIKILRVLQDKSFERVGGESTLTVDARIITATNRDLRAEVNAGRFREDLYYRLNVVNIHLPALRERPDDIPLLAFRFLEESAEEHRKEVLGFESKAAMAIKSYRWPGNVRELRNVIESVVVMSKNTYLTVEDLPVHLTERNDEEGIVIPMGISMAEAEKMIIQANLNAQGGNKSKTSEILGIGRKTLHRKIHDYGMEKEFL